MFKRMNLLCLLFVTTQAYPCSTLSYEDRGGNPWVAKSFDFSSGNGYVFINKRNIRKRSLTFDLGLSKLWVSKYGSVTFNQAGRDFPFGGMNEKGLNMEIMWLDQTDYPVRQRTGQINESQLIQYVLDTSATAEEALEKISKASIVPIMAPVHYMICDVEKACATVEYLNKKLIVTKMNGGKERILQNTPYLEMLPGIRSLGMSERESKEEMDFIFNNANALTEKTMMEKSFENLKKVEQPNWSRWQIVYNLKEKKVWFRTVKEPTIKSLSLNDYELDCRKDEQESVIDINSTASGDVKNFVIPFTKEINKELLSSFEGVPAWMRNFGNHYTFVNHVCEKIEIEAN